VELADRVLIMDKGRIVIDSNMEILNDEKIREKYGIRNPSLLIKDLEDNELSLKPGKEDIVLKISDLNYTYSGGFSLDNINFELKKRESLGIMGSNGSGKTTLAKILVGLIKPQTGQMEFKNKSMENKLNVGLIFQNPDHQLFMDSVYQELSFGMDKYDIESGELEERINSVLVSMNLQGMNNRHPHSLSGGEKQRTIISAFMVREPDILILDEPTTGMDYFHMHKLVQEIRKILKKNISIIIISHDLEFLQLATDKMLVISGGKIVREGDTRSIINPENLNNCFIDDFNLN
jgi:energy-coupling factor transport system ATP-binding protein